MKISIIVAMGLDNVIGNKGEIPWKLPNDMKWFKEQTTNIDGNYDNNVVAMGWNTYASLGYRPLDYRGNMIVTSDKKRHHQYKSGSFYGYDTLVIPMDKLEESIQLSLQDEDYNATHLWIIGGSQMYKQFLPIATALYITHVDEEFEGDTYFPYVDLQRDYKLISEIQGVVDHKNIYPHRFCVYEKK